MRWRHAVWAAVLVGSGIAAFTQRTTHSQVTPQSSPKSVPAAAPANQPLVITVSVDYGAQLLLSDSHGRKSGYDPSTDQVLSGLPEAVYVNDSISDAEDSSADAAEAESRVMEIHPALKEKYLLKVLATDRKAYNLEFLCAGPAEASSAISARDIPISPAGEHTFVVDPSSCSRQFLWGGFDERNGPAASLLTYASPAAASVHLTGLSAFPLVLVYGAQIDPSSFSATLNGNPVHNLFHAAPGKAEGVSVAVQPGRNVLQLNVAAKSGSNAVVTTTDTFTIDVD